MLYLSQAIGRPVRDRNGEPIGKVADLIVAVGDRYPPVTGLVVETDRRRIFLPWSSVASLDATGARLRTATIDIDEVPPAPERDPPAGRPARQADRRHRRAQGRPGQRPPPRRGRGRAPPRRRRRRRRRAPPPARDRGRLSRTLARNLRLPVAGALHRLGGRRPGRDARSPRSSCASRTGPGRAPPGRPRLDPRPARARATGPASSPPSTTRPSPTRSRRWSPRPRSTSSRTSHPERAADILEEMSPDDAADLVADLDQDDPRRDPRPHGAGRGRGGPGAARLPRGLRRRDHDHRVHRARRST